MTSAGPENEKATPEQLDELQRLAAAAGEEIPEGITATEAAQRLVELRGRE